MAWLPSGAGAISGQQGNFRVHFWMGYFIINVVFDHPAIEGRSLG
jgi:hypothetical protein